MDNYYEELKANFPTFNSTLRLDDRQQKSLESLISFTEGALSSFRSKVQEADSQYAQFNNEIRDQKRSEALHKAKVVSSGAIQTEFEKIENRVATAKSVLHAATHQAKPPNSTAALLQFLQQRELRGKLETMPLAERIEVLHSTCQAGHGNVLWAVENQPIVSDLIPLDILERATETLAETMAPQQAALVGLAKHDLEGALMVRNLSTVEMGHIEEGI